MSLDKLRFEKIKEEVLGKAIDYRKELTSTIEQLDILLQDEHDQEDLCTLIAFVQDTSKKIRDNAIATFHHPDMINKVFK
jgi:hypothetical protein